MMRELSLFELDRELAAELPERSLMRWRRRRHASVHAAPSHGGAEAMFGSAAASNSTQQGNSNSQSLFNSGFTGR